MKFSGFQTLNANSFLRAYNQIALTRLQGGSIVQAGTTRSSIKWRKIDLMIRPYLWYSF